MIWQFNPYIMPLLIGVVLLVLCALLAWNQSKDRVSLIFVSAVAATLGYILLYGLELSLADLDSMRMVLRFESIMMLAVVISWTLFVLAFLKAEAWLKPAPLTLLGIGSAVLIILMWTNTSHLLIWSEYLVIKANNLSFLDHDHGVIGTVLEVLPYILLAPALFKLVQAGIHSTQLHRQQVIPLIAGMLIPIVFDIGHVTGINPLPHLNLVPFGMVLGVLLIFYSMYRYRPLELSSSASYNQIVMNLPDGVIILNSSQRIIDVNPTAEELIGLSRDGVLGKTLEDVIPVSELSTLLGEGKSFHREMEVPYARSRYFDIKATPLNSNKGFIVTLRDITRRTHAERQATTLSQAVEQSGSIVFITNTQGMIEYVNSAFTRITGYLPEETLGKTPGILKSGVNIETTYDSLWKTIWSGADWQGELCNKKKNGELFWVHTTISPIKDRRGNITHFVAVQEDITALKVAEETMRRYAADLEERNKELDAYTYTIAHDLRAPLGMMIGYASFIESTTPEDRAENGSDYAQEIVKTGHKTIDMIEGLLTLARLRNADEKMVMTDINKAIADALKRFDNLISEHEIDLSIEQPILPATAHEPWVEEIFANLISNAIKYMGSQNATPCICISSDAVGKNRVRYKVRDNGLGIKEADRAKVFEMFSRVHPTEASGFGLGLAIVARMVKRMEGTLGVESEPGKGSTFWFELNTTSENGGK